MEYILSALQAFSSKIKGEIYFNSTAKHQAQLMIYATDASVYQEKPLAVVIPKDEDDIQQLVLFARKEKITLVPRAAGTSLAGQVVSNGIIVDISKHFTNILEVNAAEKWVRVQPGVIRDDLNKLLQPYGLMFGPETSTASRAMIGGMLGNNSSGLHSIVWGDTRTHVMSLKAILSDGTTAVFGPDDSLAKPNPLQNKIIDELSTLLGDSKNQQLIQHNFPKASVTRRNTGYALDSLLQMQPFHQNGSPFNICKLIAGSEGTLVFVTEIQLQLLDLPKPSSALVCVHCATLDESLRANIIALQHQPMSSELVDRYIMNFTKTHPEYKKNCFFVEGDPAAILMVEFMEDTDTLAKQRAEELITALQRQNYGYAYPVLFNKDTNYAWEVRKAGLGLLRNLPGDTQPVNLIEDCAVPPDALPDYVADLQKVLNKHQVNASYYAHAGAGELHIEPMLNLKTKEGLTLFRTILAETAALVKKYDGSLSGEHGDGRLRGEFISTMVGEETYALFKRVKQIFDPHFIFNKGKITDTPPMDTQLRVQQDQPAFRLNTYYDFSYQESMLRLAEKCSGSGDCRRSHLSGGTMCPSFMATRKEKDTTRARANILRQFLSNHDEIDPLQHDEIKEVMDLCLSCKACKTECPSGVDITKMKAEFLQHYYNKNGVPLRSRMIGHFATQMKLASAFRPVYNFIFGTPSLRKVANKTVGFHPERTMPLLSKYTLRSWYTKSYVPLQTNKKVHLFCDEFTNFYDAEIGAKAVNLLSYLGYEVIMPKHIESGRSFLSKGLVKKAIEVANQNIDLLSPQVSESAPIIGIEPSAILTLRDEYPDICDSTKREQARHLARYTFTIEEFLAAALEKGEISSAQFTKEPKLVLLHGHCYQKALSSQHVLSNVLSIPQGYQVQVIPSGCCGMAGSFGYEQEHYDVSQNVGELVLFPTVRNAKEDTIIAASGTSCRHQIKDGTSRKALHPVEILWDAIKK